MKNIILTFALLIISTSALFSQSQDSAKVRINGKTTPCPCKCPKYIYPPINDNIVDPDCIRDPFLKNQIREHDHDPLDSYSKPRGRQASAIRNKFLTTMKSFHKP